MENCGYSTRGDKFLARLAGTKTKIPLRLHSLNGVALSNHHGWETKIMLVDRLFDLAQLVDFRSSDYVSATRNPFSYLCTVSDLRALSGFPSLVIRKSSVDMELAIFRSKLSRWVSMGAARVESIGWHNMRNIGK